MLRFSILLAVAHGAGGDDGAWARWVDRYRDEHGCKGQVQTKNRLSQSLYSLARATRGGVLEVGTWRGCGSTLILAKGILDRGAKGSVLQTLEVNEHRAKEAQRMLGPLAVVNVTVSPVSRSSDIYPLAKVKNGPLPPGMRENRRSEYVKWWGVEYTDAQALELRGTRSPVAELCSTNRIDVAFLDGGEFFGLSDLREVLRGCPQLRYVALDDTRTFKHHLSMRELSADGSGWKLCASDTTERRGWAIFERVEKGAHQQCRHSYLLRVSDPRSD